MSPKKDYLDYSRFDYYLDALDLQTQTVRKSFKYDALEGVDEYTAYVLTSPIPENLSSLGALYSSIPEADATTAAVSDDSLPKYSFKARIIDANSPHSFLPDPCDIALSTDLTEQRLIKDLINLHITVFASSFTEKPKVGNYVRIRLTPGAFVYDTKVAHLVEVLTDGSKQVMASLEDLKEKSSGAAIQTFKDYPGTTLGSGTSGLEILANSLIKTNASQIVEGKELTGLTKIVNNELESWKGKKETNKERYGTLEKYWNNVNYSGWTPSGVPWSSAFISWVVNQVDAGFPKSAGHYYYAKSSSENLGGWTAWRTDGANIRAQIGDILVRPRPTKKNKNSAHGDVVFKIENNKAFLAGGNLSNTAKVAKIISLTNEGYYQSYGKYIIVLKKSGILKDRLNA